MVKFKSGVLHATRRLLIRCLPAVILAGVLPGALPTPAAAGGGGYASFTASPANDVALGTTVTITATTPTNIGPTPWYSQIYDLNTGARLGYCAFGTTCSVRVAPSAPTFGRYEAFLAALSTTPPRSFQAVTGEMDVAFNAIDVRLSITGSTIAPAGHFGVDLTATTSVNVGPTPYWIEIFDVTTSPARELVACGSGTSCTDVAILPIGPPFTFQAFVTRYTTQLPTSFQGASLYLTTGGKG